MARFTGGWIKLHRDLLNKDIGQDWKLLGMFCWFLMAATTEETTVNWRGKPRTIHPGTVVFGVSELATQFGVSRDAIYRRIQYLRDRQTISFETSTTGCLAIINKFKDYQIKPTTTRQRPDNDHYNDPTLNEEVQEGKNKYSSNFLEFWAEYPRHEAKKVAAEKFDKLSPKIQRLVIEGAKVYSSRCIAQNKSQEHILLPSTFIFQERWRDNLAPTPNQPDEFQFITSEPGAAS